MNRHFALVNGMPRPEEVEVSGRNGLSVHGLSLARDIVVCVTCGVSARQLNHYFETTSAHLCYSSALPKLVFEALKQIFMNFMNFWAL